MDIYCDCSWNKWCNHVPEVRDAWFLARRETVFDDKAAMVIWNIRYSFKTDIHEWQKFQNNTSSFSINYGFGIDNNQSNSH